MMILKGYLSNKGGETYTMSIREKVANILISLMLICLMAFAFTYEIVTMLKLTQSLADVIITVYICCICYMIIFYNKPSFVFTVLLVSMSIIGTTIYLNQKNQLQLFLVSAKNELMLFYYWLMEFVYGNSLSNPIYRNVLVIGISIIIVFIVYVLTVKKFNFLPFLVIGISYFVYKIVNKMDINKLSLYVFVFSCLLYYFKHTYISLMKKVEQDEHIKQTSFMLLGIILSSFIFGLGTLLSHTAPVELKWAHDLSHHLYRKSSEGFYYEADDFSLNQVGIGDGDTILGGNINPDDTVILEVSAPKRIYLKANSKNAYMDSSWTQTDLGEIPLYDNVEIVDDTSEMLFGVERLSNKTLEDVSSLKSIKVTFKSIKTKSLFIPLKMASIKLNGYPREIIIKNNETLKMDRLAGNNFNYEVEYYSFDYNNKDLEETLRKSYAGLYDEWPVQRANEESQLKQFSDKAKAIREAYCGLPENLPQRVKDLAFAITKDQTNDYDKVKAIEAYLASNYVYTYSPGTPNRRKDFVEHFLFENKQGYCTYFATSMAVLTRCIGLPSRYVEGYTTPATYKQGTTVYSVTNKQAHAWVEVYFEGFGWIPFEPTASYRNAFREDYGPSPVNTGMPNFTGSYSMNDEELITNIGRQNNNFMDTIINVFPIVAVILLLLLVVGIRLWKRWRLTKINARDTILHCYKQYLNIFAYQKIPMNENETPRVFARRIDQQFQFEKGTFSELTEIFLVARYSQLDIDEEQREKVLSFRKELLDHLKTQIGIPRYLLYRIQKG